MWHRGPVNSSASSFPSLWISVMQKCSKRDAKVKWRTICALRTYLVCNMISSSNGVKIHDKLPVLVYAVKLKTKLYVSAHPHNYYCYRRGVFTYGLKSAHEFRLSKFVIPSCVSPASTMNSTRDQKSLLEKYGRNQRYKSALERQFEAYVFHSL
jgi:hypothetical protein